ncbi:MAG: hypothetical protein IPN15_22375 [Saprospiraceae bacterium]|nr:hypothetical protein [Candidatus Vicinibacter affinis]
MNSYISENFKSCFVKGEPGPGTGCHSGNSAFYEDNLLTLDSLVRKANTLGINVEVLPVLNYPKNKGAQFEDFHEQQRAQLLLYSEKNNRPGFTIHCLPIQLLPPKHAGVGLPEKQEWMTGSAISPY